VVKNTIAENAPATLRASRERSMCKRSVCKCLAIVGLHVRRINGAIKGWFLALEAGRLRARLSTSLSEVAGSSLVSPVHSFQWLTGLSARPKSTRLRRRRGNIPKPRNGAFCCNLRIP
jgi:hypothetical protein